MTHTGHKLLIIEDDSAIRTVLRALLESEGYRLVEAATAARGEIEARSQKPDLLLVDLGLPDADGLSVIRHVRSWSVVPIIVLSARALEEQKIAALDAGADDYVTKPFSAPELLARVRAGLRRRLQGGQEAPIMRLGLLQVDLARRRAQGSAGNVHLTPLEYRLLDCLARQAGMVVRQRDLLREVWGPDKNEDTRTVRVYIKNLRSKIEPDPRKPRFLITEAGLGYRLQTDEEEGEVGPGSI